MLKNIKQYSYQINESWLSYSYISSENLICVLDDSRHASLKERRFLQIVDRVA